MRKGARPFLFDRLAAYFERCRRMNQRTATKKATASAPHSMMLPGRSVPVVSHSCVTETAMMMHRRAVNQIWFCFVMMTSVDLSIY